MRITLDRFFGMAPRIDPHLLAGPQARFAANARLTSGALQPIRSPLFMWEEEAAVRRVIAMYSLAEERNLFISSNVNTDLVYRVVIEDQFERFYYVEPPGPIMYQTLADFLFDPEEVGAGDPPFPWTLGLPRPPVFAVNPSGGSGSTESRAYAMAYVTAYGEVGPLSVPTVVSSPIDATWQVVLPTTNPGPTLYNIEAIRLYRTIPGTSTDFFMIEDVPLGTATYDDTSLGTDLTNNLIAENEAWDSPPPVVDGLCQHASGFLCAWRGNMLYFSEPYLPHAWPVAFAFPLPYLIKAVIPVSNVLVVLTAAHPYLLIGRTPDQLQPLDLNALLPCIGKRSAVVFGTSVIYNSPHGLVAVDASGNVQVITTQIATKLEWEKSFISDDVVAALYGSEYLCFTTPGTGFSVQLDNVNAGFVALNRYSGIAGLDTDPHTSEVFVGIGSSIYKWDGVTDADMRATWSSKLTKVAKPTNFGAFQLKFDVSEDAVTTDVVAASEKATYNASKFSAGPLDTINLLPLNGRRNEPVTKIRGEVPPVQSIAGDTLYRLFEGLPIGHVTLRVFADKKKVYERVVPDEKTHRLPSGFKSTDWSIEIVTNAIVNSFDIATTPQELETI